MGPPHARTHATEQKPRRVERDDAWSRRVFTKVGWWGWGGGENGDTRDERDS